MANKKGFTLMEIMVVIIVIAVLASVAGPMIGSITDQGRASATKSKLSSLKSALLAYQQDVGRMPYVGKVGCISSYNAEKLLCTSCEDLNVLVSDSNSGFGSNVPNRYAKKWKGPYMDADPEDFMVDAWGNDIKYVAKGKNLYIWSYGPDGEAYGNVDEAYKAQSENSDECDDIVISVWKRKRAFN